MFGVALPLAENSREEERGDFKGSTSYSVVLKARPRKSEVALCLRDMLMSFWKYKICAELRRENSLTNHAGKLRPE